MTSPANSRPPFRPRLSRLRFLSLACWENGWLATALILMAFASQSSVDASTYSLLNQFNGADGETPSALILAADGNFYGTTRAGGQSGDGTIFKVTPAGELTTLHNFSGDDGIEPNGLVQGDDGNFYGTTRSGGANDEGTVFKLTTANTFTTLHDFPLGRPFGGLVKADNGQFYGRSGGGVYKITSQGDFTNFPGGYGYNQSGEDVDRAGLTVGIDGNLYGTEEKYPFCCNDVFQMTPDGLFTTLYTFEGLPPQNVYGPDGVTQGDNGNLYGKAIAGVYQVTLSGNLTVIHEFDYPYFHGPLIKGQDGNLYGISGESDAPTFLFKLTPSGAFSKLYTGLGNGGTLLQQDGENFYGTYPSDGFFGKGTVFRISLLDLAPAQLQNISTRLRIQMGENVLIGGFIITGSAPKNVIVRGIGPSLATFGVSGALADPVLELHKPDGSIVTNDDWKATQQTEIEATGLAPTDSKESAVLATLAPGIYTAILSGKSSSVGVGLVEIYDLDSASVIQLANISTRGFVETGDNVMIGGMIVGPSGTPGSTMLVRATGPSLTNFGIQNALPDPMLELHDSNGALLASDDDWKDSQEAEIAATGLAPADDREAAILSTLAPGSYTAIVQGFGNTTGVGLVEAYNLQ